MTLDEEQQVRAIAAEAAIGASLGVAQALQGVLWFMVREGTLTGDQVGEIAAMLDRIATRGFGDSFQDQLASRIVQACSRMIKRAQPSYDGPD